MSSPMLSAMLALGGGIPGGRISWMSSLAGIEMSMSSPMLSAMLALGAG
eukprot:CAMPEP_0182870736 /NCGR_PEP_ID=MMETSP0034_2-20130328/10709_1 /TAXON_ID=156128 /ORGANISM="Nephroselmis pyriformis, Strain CCMP717" /LENGTH=48 /DNA_ID= /DNA_START= /DNA_END= /DNA_ORIENTATION=